MAAVMAEDSDIDSFLTKQKDKLQDERHTLTKGHDIRRHWDRSHHMDNRLAEEQEQKYLPEENGLTLDDHIHNETQQQLREERMREYNDYLQKHQTQSPRRRPKTPAETGLPLGKYEDERKKLNTERQKEYNEKILKEPSPKRDPLKKFEDSPRKRQGRKPSIDYQERYKEMQEEKHQEYLEHLEKKHLGYDSKAGAPMGLPPRPQKKQREERQERQEEYKQYMAEQKLQTRGLVPEDVGENLATLPGIQGHQSAELIKMKERNDEYNVFLREKREQEIHRFDDKKPARHGKPENVDPKNKNKQEIFASIPGLSYSNSPQIKKEIERNKEYNDFLNHKRGGPPGRGLGHEEMPPTAGTRTGWKTPTYEEILEQKRKEEAQYRRNDPDYDRQQDVEDRKAEREFYARRAKFPDNQQGILDDDEWLNPDRRETEYAELRGERRPEVDQIQEDEKVDHSDKENRARTDAPYHATLPVGRSGIIGQDSRESAKKRKGEEYRKELELQIKETNAAKRREKLQDLKVNDTGFLDHEQNANRMRQLGQNPREVSPRREYHTPDVQPYHTKFDLQQREPHARRSILDAERDLDDGGLRSGRPRDRGGSGGYHSTGILERGFDGLLEPRRHLGGIQAPTGLAYQPSTYITAGNTNTMTGLSGPPLSQSSIDEAYHYYGMRNPLEPDSGVPPMSLGQADQRVSFGQGGQPSPTPRVTFDETATARRVRDRSKERISPYQFSSEEVAGNKSRQEQQSYQAELDRQVYEKKMKQARDRESKEMHERKLEDDMKNYNPFGRGGGGAPIKDGRGNAIADLRLVLKGNESGEMHRTPRYESPSRMSPTLRIDLPKDDLIKAPPSQTNFTGETTFARGGHGIFGMPKTDSEKTQMEKYKDELRKQIEEKKLNDQLEKEKEMFEEEKENKHLEQQRLKIQAEYEAEFRKAKDKEEEARRRNEEIKQQAEERKKENVRKKKEVEEKQSQKLREQEDRNRQERLKEQEVQQRLSSPPVPAARKLIDETDEKLKTRHQGGQEPQPGSSRQSELKQPSPDPSRFASGKITDSVEVLGELSRLRKQLETERMRVENALDKSKNEPEVFDPRMVQRPPLKERGQDQRAPRSGTSYMTNQRNLQTFNELKYNSNSDSRQQFRSHFPDVPTSGSALETQQDALLRQQEGFLQNSAKGRPRYKKKGLFEKSSPNPQPKDLGLGRPGTVSPRSLLMSNSAFIDVEGVNHFPDDFEDMPQRNISTGQGRTDRYPPSPRQDRRPYNALGSNISLDVDKIQQKNDDRLRKLQMINTTDDVSLADPDDVLDRFIAKQSYNLNRPPSGQTLQDDSWLRPGSKRL